jgi:hypothetical protein
MTEFYVKENLIILFKLVLEIVKWGKFCKVMVHAKYVLQKLFQLWKILLKPYSA